MLIRIYLYRNRFLLPTIGEIDTGWYRDIEPVHELPMGDAGALSATLRLLVAAGNPIVVAPAPGNRSKPHVVKRSGANSWRAFEREARAWKVLIEASSARLIPYRLADDGGFEEDTSAAEEFELAKGVDPIARRIVSLAAQS